MYRPSTGDWHVVPSRTSIPYVVSWGLSTDTPVPGDYGGDGKTDLAVYRRSTGVWYILHSNTNNTTSTGVSWGLPADVPVPGDYDGDGKVDPAIFRPSVGLSGRGLWAILKSSTGFTTSSVVSWGLGTDTPINKRQ